MIKKYLRFAAPLTERSFCQQYYGMGKCTRSVPDSLYEFVVKIFTVIYKERSEILGNSLGVGKSGKSGKIFEQMWQKGFYRIGTRELGNDYFLPCDVGSVLEVRDI